MDKRAPSLASNHHTVRVAMLDADQRISVVLPPTPELVFRSIERALKKQLQQSLSDEAGIEITARGLRPVRVVLKWFGTTALVAGVLRGNEKVVESLTVCRAGFDSQEDDAAMQGAATLIVYGSGDVAVDSRVERLLERVREHRSPLAVHFHLDEPSFADMTTRVVTHCLAESFFDLFGMEKSFEATDV